MCVCASLLIHVCVLRFIERQHMIAQQLHQAQPSLCDECIDVVGVGMSSTDH
jgi:hypothetical protein